MTDKKGKRKLILARKFQIQYLNFTYELDYDSQEGFEGFKARLFSYTSVLPENQLLLGGDNYESVMSNDFDLQAIDHNRLQLLEVDDNVNDIVIQQELDNSNDDDNSEMLKSDEALARQLQAEEEALMLKDIAADDRKQNFEYSVRSYANQLRMYEDPVRQEAARKSVPVEDLEEKALVSLAKEGIFQPSKFQQDHAFLLQLLFWFKGSFSWVDNPPCENCGHQTTYEGQGPAQTSELLYGGNRVELYRCNVCSIITRFPRYTDPMKLVETRRGRCGEWANCFTLYCRAFGYESRLILDFTDHVWTECFSQSLGRWMHLDPCEGVYDKPLLYEKGWNKKLTYIIGIAKDGAYDVTKRYTRKWLEVLSRRKRVTESGLSAMLDTITKDFQRTFTSQVISSLEDRHKQESEEIERALLLEDDGSVSLPGRQSGDKSWRISRSEIGSNEDGSLSCSSCPVRVCIDEHVTKIYNAFFPVLSQFVENSVSEYRALEIIKIFREIVVKLRTLPYKNRRTLINAFLLLWLPYFDELLNAISMKIDIDGDAKVSIYLAGDPIKTSLSLPVLLDALDDVTLSLNRCGSWSNVSLSYPLIRLNRIHSGSVLASGEELPFGIATSAFDGLRTTKWEEPNGAKGCWIVYRLQDNQMHELAAYDLMSANDAPERDPMDWFVEGSSDKGSSWQVLDEQTSQVFENRFQRKSFKIRSKKFLCNAFRFRFLAVKDVHSTSRLQLGSIDLYASSSVV